MDGLIFGILQYFPSEKIDSLKLVLNELMELLYNMCLHCLQFCWEGGWVGAMVSDKNEKMRGE